MNEKHLSNDLELYVKSIGKIIKITRVFDSVKSANDFCEEHDDEGVIGTIGAYVLMAKIDDTGCKMT